MDWADYLRDEAAKYRQLAETAESSSFHSPDIRLADACLRISTASIMRAF
jgi:hypothetical protein